LLGNLQKGVQNSRQLSTLKNQACKVCGKDFICFCRIL